VGEREGRPKVRQALLRGMPVRLKLRPDLVFVHSALFMMDAIVLTDSEIPPAELGFSDRP
jgi:hypothetical protein